MNCRAMTDGRHSFVAMRGTQISCQQLPVTVTIDLESEFHVETITVTSDWYAKRPKTSTVKAQLHDEDVWHPVSFDEHQDFSSDDRSCGDGIKYFGGLKCCYPPASCNGGVAGSFHNITLSVVTDKLQIVFEASHCNGNTMYIDEILVWGNEPTCQDRCLNDCSGRGTCTPYAVDGKLGDVLREGPDQAQYVCTCKTNYTGSDCSKEIGCKEDGFPFCGAMDGAFEPKASITACEPDHDPVSTNVFVAHNDEQGCGYLGSTGSDNYVHEGIENSDILEVAKSMRDVESGSSVNELMEANRDSPGGPLGMVITTTSEGVCPSMRMRLIDTKVTSLDCYSDFWAFQCVADCTSSCCEMTTTTSTTTPTTTTTATTTTSVTGTTQTQTTATGTTTTTITATTATTTSESTMTRTITTTITPTTTATTTSDTETTTTTTTITTTSGTTTTTAMGHDEYLELSIRQLKKLKSAAELMADDIGMTPLEMEDVGFSVVEIASAASESRLFTATDLAAVPGMDAVTLANSGFNANSIRAAGYSEASLESAGFSTAEIKAAAAFAPPDSNTSPVTMIVVVAVALVLVIVLVAAVMVKNSSADGGGSHPAVAFENPMYGDASSSQGTVQQTYNNGNGGYMDVNPTYESAAAGSSAGYMDVNPAYATAADGTAGGESSEEEV
jgi:hypothetical protein